MTPDAPWELQDLPGFAAVRTYAQLSRDFAELWSGTSQQMVLLSVETNEAALEAVRANFGRWAIPGAEVWNWWAAATAGFFGAYSDLAQRRAAAALPAVEAPATAAPPVAAEPPAPATVELDLTEEESPVDVRPRERIAAADVEIPQATASTTRRRRSGGPASTS